MLPCTRRQTPSIISLPSYHPGTDPFFLSMPSFTLLAAMYANSHLLGISCVFPVPHQFTPVNADIPVPLHPVHLQKDVIHVPYIDCLPIPKLRHNLILFNGLIDDNSFCFDLIYSSGFVVAGSQSWDPSGWVISPAFKEKWSFLFD
jgi:hypothetical protein